MNISELIAAIRIWQAAYAAYLAAVAESPDHMSRQRQEAAKALDKASLEVAFYGDTKSKLEAFVALADIVEPALKLAATVERHQLPISGTWTHKFDLRGETHGWVDQYVDDELRNERFLGALIELVQAVEKEGSNHG